MLFGVLFLPILALQFSVARRGAAHPAVRIAGYTIAGVALALIVCLLAIAGRRPGMDLWSTMAQSPVVLAARAAVVVLIGARTAALQSPPPRPALAAAFLV